MVADANTVVVSGLVLLAVMGALALGATFVAYRWLTRRWRLVKAHVVTRSALATWDGVRVLRHRRTPRRSAAGWSPAKARREMWWAVDGADHALAHAVEMGAAVADLPSLNRRLHRAATDLDRLLAIHPGGAPLGPQVDHLLGAATDLRLAAVRAAGEACGPVYADLAADAEREFQALSEGLARSRTAGTLPA